LISAKKIVAQKWCRLSWETNAGRVGAEQDQNKKVKQALSAGTLTIIVTFQT
jgi:hypothetical protein